MKKLLVPTDFSENAFKAVTYAASIAQQSGASIYLLHVIEPFTESIRQPYALHDKLDAAIMEGRERELEVQQKSVAALYPTIPLIVELAKGTVINAIVDFAAAHQIDLIIMGTTGASGLKEIFMGSVAAGIIGKSIIPVLTVPAIYEPKMPATILFATHSFEQKKVLLEPIVELARLFNACIQVTVFIDTDEAEAPDYLFNTRRLNQYMQFLTANFPAVIFKSELLEGSEFEATIAHHFNQNNVDIIAMITYPKNFLERIMGKSRTKKMAFHSTIPLLAIPANAGVPVS